MAEHDEAPSPRRGQRPRLRVPTRVLAYLGVLAAGLIIGWVLFGNDDDAPAPLSEPTATLAPGQRRVPVDARLYPRFGLAIGVPKGWSTTVRRGVLNAASPDQRVSVAFSVAAGAGHGPRVRRADRRQIARLFAAKEVSRRRAKVGAAPTIVTELAGRTRGGKALRILSMAASSHWRTYSVQVFTVPAPGASRLLQLRALLTSVGFSEPA